MADRVRDRLAQHPQQVVALVRPGVDGLVHVELEVDALAGGECAGQPDSGDADRIVAQPQVRDHRAGLE